MRAYHLILCHRIGAALSETKTKYLGISCFIMASYKIAPVHESKGKAHLFIIIHFSFTNKVNVSTKDGCFESIKACYEHKQPMVGAAI